MATHPPASPSNPAGPRSIAQIIAGADPTRMRLALAGLTPAVKAIYDRDTHGFAAAWTVGNPADFLATTLYRDTRHVLRLHVHAPGAADCDLHTHKGIVRSTVLNGSMHHERAHPRISDTRTPGGLDVWQCGSPQGRHVMAKTHLSATIDPTMTQVVRLQPGAGFRLDPGQYHRVAASDDPHEPTVSLCLFEIDDTHRPEPYVLTNRPTPTVAERAMTPDYARTALRRILDRGLDYALAG